MSFPRYYILGGDDGHQVVAVHDALEWGYWFEHADRVVGQTGDPIWRVGRGGEPERYPGVTVSTVFIGMDHRFFGDGPPMLFETMCFGGPLDGATARYGSWAAAEAGHRRWVERAFPALAKEKAKKTTKAD